MIDKDSQIKLLEAQIETMTELARKASDRAGIYEKGLRAVMTHIELILGEQAHMSSTHRIAAESLMKAGQKE